MRKITKRTATIVATAALGVGALGATAWASGWFKSSTTGSVTTATAAPITGNVAITSLLYPTGSGNVTLTVANPNKYKMKITGISIASGETISGGCTAENSGITFDSPTNLVLPEVTVKTATPANYTITGLAHMASWADDACEGITGTDFKVTLNGSIVS